MAKKSAKIIETGLNKDKLLHLKEILKNKIKQYNYYKYFLGPISFLQKMYIKKLRKKYEKENSKAEKPLGNATNILSEDKKSFKVLNTYWLGTDYNLQPVLISNANQHISLFGGSGSGKSVWTFMFINQTIRKGGGAVFVDGKADLNMYTDFIRMAADHERLDDVLVLNFNDPEPGKRISNSFNVFKVLPLEEIKKIIDSITVGKNSDFFAKQSQTVLDSVFLILESMKSRNIELNFNVLLKALDLKALVVNLVPANPSNPNEPDPNILSWNGLEEFKDFWIPRNFVYNGRLAYEEVVSLVNKYGAELWYNEEDAEYNRYQYKPNEQLVTQIAGYSGMTLSGIKNIVMRYQHIFESPINDIDFEKVIYQNKIVYVLIPAMAMEKIGPHATAAFVLESLKIAAAKSLGKDTNIGTGSKLDYFQKLQVTANPTFPIILDELAAFFELSIEAIGLFIAQARSINISVILSTQDAASIAGAEGGKAFLDKAFASTLTSVFLKTQDEQTLPYARSIILRKSTEINEKGEQVASEKEEEMLNFLKTAKNGLGVILNEDFGKVLTPYAEPKTDISKIKFSPSS